MSDLIRQNVPILMDTLANMNPVCCRQVNPISSKLLIKNNITSDLFADDIAGNRLAICGECGSDNMSVSESGLWRNNAIQ